jgi:hypothetical protein
MSESTRAVKQVVRFQSFQDVCVTAQGLYQAQCCPNGVDRWEKLVPILLTGAELGLGVMQSLKAITPAVNGVCALYGDTGLAMVRASGELEKLDERIDGDGDDRVAVCEIKRKGYSSKSFSYPMSLAKKLVSYKKQHDKKIGPWYENPENMLKWRARWLAMRTEFTDVLAGMGGAEEEEAITVEATVKESPSALPLAIPPGGPTEAQLTEMSRLRPMLLGGNHTDDDLRAAWLAELATFQVTSAKALTTEQAAAFITQIGRKCDPFTYPASGTTEATGQQS